MCKEDMVSQEEQVLVVERSVLDRVGAFEGLCFEVDRYLREIFAPGVSRFMARSAAEHDPGYKQIIPYVIMRHEGRYLSYVRGKRAGETRLVGNRSIGIGGHINPEDYEAPLFDNARVAYEEAVQREVAEEVSVETAHTDRVVALLNDDSNEVGRVHLGVVHLWTLESSKVEKREQMITQMGFLTAQELEAERESLETWSQRCLDGLGKMAGSDQHD